jgi:hypothetical protein
MVVPSSEAATGATIASPRTPHSAALILFIINSGSSDSAFSLTVSGVEQLSFADDLLGHMRHYRVD